MLGSLTPTPLDLGDLDRRLKHTEYAEVIGSLKGIHINNAFTLLSTYAGSKADLRPWLVNAQINRDNNMRLQYLAGMGLNLDQSDSIFDEMRACLTFPEHLIVTPPQKRLLKRMITNRLGRR